MTNQEMLEIQTIAEWELDTDCLDEIDRLANDSLPQYQSFYYIESENDIVAIENDDDLIAIFYECNADGIESGDVKLVEFTAQL